MKYHPFVRETSPLQPNTPDSSLIAESARKAISPPPVRIVREMPDRARAAQHSKEIEYPSPLPSILHEQTDSSRTNARYHETTLQLMRFL